MLVLEIAGGILLAVMVLAILPAIVGILAEIFARGVWLLQVALAACLLGGVLAGPFLLFDGIVPGQGGEVVAVLLAVGCVGFVIFDTLAFHRLKRNASAKRVWPEDTGG